MVRRKPYYWFWSGLIMSRYTCIYCKKFLRRTNWNHPFEVCGSCSIKLKIAAQRRAKARRYQRVGDP